MPILHDIRDHKVLGREYERGFEEGFKIGFEEGRQQGRKDTLIRLLSRYVPNEAQSRLQALPLSQLRAFASGLLNIPNL